MSKRKGLYDRLNTSVADQSNQARDKFDNADLVVAMSRLKQQRPEQTAMDASQVTAVEHALPSRATSSETDTAPSDSYVVRAIPIANVKDHPRNARQVYDPARIDEMATSIARDGQRVPAVVMPDPAEPGSYLLIEGRYRKRALQSLGRSSLLASIVEPLSDLEAYRLSLLLNEERNDQTILDNALSWRTMLDDGTYRSQDHIAEHLNIKQGTVSKTLALLDLPAGVLNIIKTRPASFGIRIAQELRQLSKLVDEAALESVAEQVIDEKLSVRDLERLRDRKTQEPLTRERSRAYPLQWGNVRLGSIREFEDGRLKIDLSNAPENLRADIISAVKKTLAETPASQPGLASALQVEGTEEDKKSTSS
ncbi:ParB/RepB/Spo0J family partition protein [Noviherbaspirillum sp. L7-7A]|uniref:ParB/RepB/Spo0J family partition protein n=1 Tax=Noviherbaspirillum sp. L7-7A TaxID=2850560 RepID=UPI001C2BFD5D|nr:ParB/RepB/Spo0J family partition protein [Noviherbaspirillum sp. L7-7A]MBV0881792.1 ParB/RepB/Spo0J family partition protein [Noviherbaspirillum sp. L7-7A]